MPPLSPRFNFNPSLMERSGLAPSGHRPLLPLLGGETYYLIPAICQLGALSGDESVLGGIGEQIQPVTGSELAVNGGQVITQGVFADM